MPMLITMLVDKDFECMSLTNHHLDKAPMRRRGLPVISFRSTFSTMGPSADLCPLIRLQDQ